VSGDEFGHRRGIQRLMENDLHGRWMAANRARTKAEDALRAGMLVRFTADELDVLRSHGYLCPADESLLRRMAAAVNPAAEPEADPVVTIAGGAS